MESVGIALPLYETPAVLMRWQACHVGLRHIVCADDVEIRPDLQGEAGLPVLAVATAARLRALIRPAAELVLGAMGGTNRPLTESALPCCGAIAGLTNIYSCVAHHGVILAPYLSRLIVDQVLNN